MKSFGYLFLISTIVFFTSCLKDDLTKPAEVTFQFLLDNQQMDGKFLEIQGGALVIKEIGFEGYRESGEDVFFTSDFEQLIVADLATGNSSEQIKFDIPQGIYHHINLSIEIDGNNQDPGLKLEGTYHSVRHGPVPVAFDFALNEILNLNPKPGHGKNKIILNKDIPTLAETAIRTGFMFQVLNSRMLESAEITQQDGADMIVVSKESNQHIFNLLVNRIENSARVTFK